MGKSTRKKRKEGQPVQTLQKISVIVKGNKSSQTISTLLPQLHRFRSQHSILFNKKHADANPFQHPQAFQNFIKSKQASLFVFGSNSKKRPNNLIFGRTFDFQILDLFQFEVISHTPAKNFSTPSLLGLKPLMVFQGDLFQTEPVYFRLKNLFQDYFSGKALNQVDTKSLNQTIAITASEDGHIHFHHYRIDGGLQEIGPSFELELRRNQVSNEKVFKIACKVVKKKKKKNVSTNVMRQKKGKLHVQQQDIKTIELKKRKYKHK